MNGPRFERLELDYGRHSAAFELVPDHGGAEGNGAGRPVRESPFVVTGPNGSGKSTLMEALLRTLFGFRRVRRDDRDEFEARRPWSGGPYRGRVVLRTPNGRMTFERDFETDRVRVLREGEEAPLFEDEANPTRASETVRRYREILEPVIGLTELDQYRRTACIVQGGLLGTGLSPDLLRVAAGGHADVETAFARLVRDYHALTVEPIAPDAAARRKAGALERLGDTIAELEARLGDARSAGRKRAPLIRARDENARRLAELEEEIDRLGCAFETLSETARLEAEADAARARIRSLEAAERELDEALARTTLLLDRESATNTSSYPEDFASRARLLEEGWWPRRRALRTELEAVRERLSAERSGRWIPFGAAIGLSIVLGAILLLGGAGWPGWLALLAGIAGAAGVLVHHRGLRERGRVLRRQERELSRELESLEGRVSTLLAGVPDAASLGPETLPDRLRAFEREERDRRLVVEARDGLRRSMDDARRAISLHAGERAEREAPVGESDEEPPEVASGPASGGALVDRARELLDALHERIALEREDHLAPIAVELRARSKARFELPAGVDPDLDAVRLARRARLEESDRLRGEASAIDRALATEARAEESPVALEAELADRREERRALEVRAAAYRHAHDLVTRAYEAFRRTDEERLLAAISYHLARLSGGRLGPLEAPGGLDEATLRAGGRSLPLESPPLSYGQLHIALLAVRVGAADFLAGLGVRVPLLIDDPFVHLDERSSEQLWDLLRRVAESRQVIIATQDRLVLDHLGVSPDLDLPAPEAGAVVVEGAASGGDDTAVDLPGEEGATPGPGEEGTAPDPAGEPPLAPYLDLWEGSERG